MSIIGDRDFGYEVECDICGEETDEGHEEFMDAVAWKKENGWKSRKDSSGSWMDVCPTCIEEGKS